MHITEQRLIAKLADEAHSYMEQRTRADGSKFWTHKDGAPQWVTDLCMKAHGDMLPDDWRYETIEQALVDIVESEGDFTTALDSIEPDIYNSDLLKWLASRVDRYCYVDEAVEEFGNADSIVQDIAEGQRKEMQEVYELVYNFLQEHTEEVAE